jgi:hypothetical protein
MNETAKTLLDVVCTIALGQTLGAIQCDSLYETQQTPFQVSGYE